MLKFNMKNLYIAIGVAILFIVMLAQPPKGYTIPTYLTVREVPNSSTVVFTLERGQVVSVLENNGEWAKIKRGGLVGWARGIYLLDADGYRLYDTEVGVSREECPTCWITNRTWFTPSPDHFIGKSTFYAPNVMEAQVIRTAGRLGLDPKDYVGGVATASAADIGKTVWLKRQHGIWEGPYLISDVSQRNHAWGHVGVLGQAVEVDYKTAVRWGMASTGSNWRILRGSIPNVQVFKGSNPALSGLPVDYQKWYIDMAEFALPRQPNWQGSPIYYLLNN